MLEDECEWYVWVEPVDDCEEYSESDYGAMLEDKIEIWCDVLWGNHGRHDDQLEEQNVGIDILLESVDGFVIVIQLILGEISRVSLSILELPELIEVLNNSRKA